MQLDQKKYDRQKVCFQRWIDDGCRGVLEAVTGFGKTMVSIMAIKDMNSRHADRTTIVVVPFSKLKDDWTGYWAEAEDGSKTWVKGHIEIHGLLNVQVFVVNTYVKYVDWKCDLLVLDEIHHYASHESKFFSTVLHITTARFVLGLSATLNEKEKEFLEEAGLSVFDVVSDLEGERDGYITQSITYNLAVPLTEKDKKFNTDINQTFNYYFAKFDHDFNVMRACNMPFGASVYVKLNNGTSFKKTSQDWRKWLALKNGWNGDAGHPYSPDNISKYAAQGMMLVKKRKDKWQNLPSKIDIVEKLIKRINLKTVVFCESAAMADKIADRLGSRAMAYHTRLRTIASKDGEVNLYPKDGNESKALRKQGYTITGKTALLRKALTEFKDPNSQVNTLVVVRALDEGFDDATIEFILMVAYHSTKRQNVQREGRGKRIDYDNANKKTLITNLYVKGTQEEKWLKSKQKGKKGLVRWVDSPEDISLDTVISLSKPLVNVDLEAVPDTTTPISSNIDEVPRDTPFGVKEGA